MRVAWLLSLLLWASPAWAVLPATTVFEVHPANGNDTFGACYNTATVVTDYTNQDTAQLTLTDCATSGAGITTVTSVTGGFTAAMVGNCIRIDSGTNVTPGFYMITSRTDTNTIAVDRAPDNAVGGISGGACKVGGAAKTFESATTNDLSDALVAGAKVWVKNEAMNEAVTSTISGTGGSPIILEGYNTTRGDAPTGSTRPTNDRAAGAGDAWNISGSQYIVRYLIGKSAAADGFDSGGQNIVYEYCRATANGADGFVSGDNDRSNSTWFYLESDLNTGDGFQETGGASQGRAVWSYAHDNTAIGFNLATHVNIFGVISESNASHGTLNGSGSQRLVLNSVFDGNTGVNTDGINRSTNTGLGVVIANNIVSNNGDDGLVGGTIPALYQVNFNNVYNNTGAAYTGFTAGANDITTDPSFTDRANGDFTLASGSGALGAGLPQSIPGATGDYQWNIGVDQDDVCAGGTGGAGGWGF